MGHLTDLFARRRLARATKHTIVCGSSESASLVSEGFDAIGEHVVVASPDLAALVAAGLERAGRLVVATGDDLANIEAVAAALEHLAPRRTESLRVAIELEDPMLHPLVRVAARAGPTGTQVHSFDLVDRGARTLVATEGPDRGGAEVGPGAHVVVVGLGRFGAAAVLALCQRWVSRHGDVKFCPTLVDPDARRRWEALARRHRALAESCEPTLVDIDLTSPDPDTLGELLDLLSAEPPVWIGVMVDSEAAAVAGAVALDRYLPPGSGPVVVRVNGDSGLGGLLAPGPDGERAYDRIRAFPALDRVSLVASVNGGLAEQLAQALYEDGSGGADESGDGEAPAHWRALTREQAGTCRSRADGIAADLESMGFELAPLRWWGSPGAPGCEPFGRDELEHLAIREHQRWLQDRLASGWTYGEQRDDDRCCNPLLVDWDRLPANVRAANRASAAAVGPLLVRNGFEAVRR